MHMFGKNFYVLFATSKKCTVSPFLLEYSEQVDVKFLLARLPWTSKMFPHLF